MIQSIMEAIDRDERFTDAKRNRLQDRYNEALRNGEDVFEFEGREYLTDYAKYLLVYLDQTLGPTH